MRFLVDESSGYAIVRYLSSVGYDVISVSDGAAQSPDQDVLAWAVRENRVLITSDRDFGELIFHKGQPHRGLIYLRLQDDTAASQVRVIADVIERYGEELAERYMVVTDRTIRVRNRTLDSSD